MFIRNAVAEDATVLWEAEVETAKIPGRLISRPDELALTAFSDKIDQFAAEGRYVVAVEGDTIVGHAFLDRLPHAALQHVVHLTVVVHPGYTGRGIGTALLTHLQEWARRDRRTSKIELRVRASNAAAIKLYQRVGFVEEGRNRNRVQLPDGQLVDDIMMAWFPDTQRS
jgi:RimJ/RimL family protein N-acetyltransferase